MAATISTPASGVRAAQDLMRTAVRDVARESVKGAKAEKEPAKAARHEPPAGHADEKMVEMLRAKHAAMANMKALKMQDRMVGHLVDKKA